MLVTVLCSVLTNVILGGAVNAVESRAVRLLLPLLLYFFKFHILFERNKASLTLARILFPQGPAIRRVKSRHFSGTDSVKTAR